MSTDPSSPMDKLSPSWIRRSISRRKKSLSDTDSQFMAPDGLLSPSTASTSSNSDESRSTRQSRRPSLRGMVNKIRSPSNASQASTKSQTLDFDEIDNWFQGFRKYNTLVTDISSSPEDRTADLAKASKALTKHCGGRFLHSLPESAFDFSLLWCPAGQLSRKDGSDEPSWSWSSYNGPINYPFDPTTCPDIYTRPRSEGEWFRSEIVNFHVGPPATPYTVRREKCNSLRIKYPPYFHAPRGADASVESNTLRFTASAISADGFEADQLHYEDKEIPVSRLLNEKGQHCGVVMDFESAISQPSATGPYEFILLSRNLRRESDPELRRPSVATMHPPGTPIWDGERFVWTAQVHDFDEGVFEDGEWKMLNVLLVRWVGEYAERVAVARIHEDEWVRRGPVRKDVVLR